MDPSASDSPQATMPQPSREASRDEPGVLSPRPRATDPVVLSVLRVFFALQVVTLGVSALAFLGHDSPRHATTAVWAMLGACTALLVCSLVPALRRRPAYLPVALAATLAIPAMGQALALLQGAQAFEKMALEQALVLVVPLLIVAWQYSFRTVVVLALATAGVDVGLALLAGIGHERGEVYLHLLLSRTAGLLLAGYVVSRLVGEQRTQHRNLARAHAQLTRQAAGMEQLAISRERNRLARELHDTLAHTLSALAVQLEAVRSRWGEDPAEARALVDGARTTARAGLGEVRRALRALRASPLEDLGLGLALRSLAETLGERTGVQVHVTLPDGHLDLTPSVEQGLYRIAQETVENVERHTNATHLRMDLGQDAGLWTLAISDDGCGFDPARVPEERYGLRGIRERAELLGAALVVDSAPGRGTTVKLTLPTSAIQDELPRLEATPEQGR